MSAKEDKIVLLNNQLTSLTPSSETFKQHYSTLQQANKKKENNAHTGGVWLRTLQLLHLTQNYSSLAQQCLRVSYDLTSTSHLNF